MTWLNFRMWGTTTPATLTKTPLWDFNFMPWEKGNRGFRVHVRKAWEYFLAEDSQSVQQWCKTHECHRYFWSSFPPVLNLYHQWNIWRRLSSFHCMSQLLKTTQIFHLFDLFIYFYSQTEHMTPAPLSLAIPNTMPSFRGKWVNQQWNEDELIMPHNLLWVTF